MSLGYAERLSYKDDVGAVGMRERPKEGSLDLRKKVPPFRTKLYLKKMISAAHCP